VLLKHGADASKKNRDGHTPLDLVKEGDQVRGVCTKNRDGYTPLDLVKEGDQVRGVCC
jgi:tankyrase